MAVCNKKKKNKNKNFEHYYKLKIIIMREQQAKKHCQTFMNKLQNTNIYDNIR